MCSSSTRIAVSILIVVVVMLVIVELVRGDDGTRGEMVLTQNKTSNSSSVWLKRVMNPRAIGCRKRPWICKDEGFRFPPKIKKWCCKNRCVDVSSDVNNCGLCGIKCPFTWQCCNGLCIDTNVNPFHCGKCRNKCAFGSLCFYGICGYAQPLPPFPFPLPPKIPLPPFPFPPKIPLPPFPFPPKPPKPFPPKPPKTHPY